MVKEAEQFAKEDEKRRQEVEVKNQADALAYASEKSLKDLGDKVPADERTKIEEKIKLLRTAQAGSDTEAVKKAMEELTQVSHKLAEQVYKQSQEKAGPQPGDSAAPGSDAKQSNGDASQDDKVVDAEFKVDDEKKNNA